MRPIQIWVPDVTAPGFAEEARRQSLLAASDPDTGAAQDFADALAEWDDE